MGIKAKGPQDEGWLTARNQSKLSEIWLGKVGFGSASFKQKKSRFGPVVRYWGR